MSDEDDTTTEETDKVTEDTTKPETDESQEDATDKVTEDTTKPETDESQEDATDEKDETWDPERAKRKIAKLNSEAANLRKRVNEAPKADDVAAKDQWIGELEKTALRYEVAFDLGLPKQIAKRLQGNTREEMVADAEELLEEFSPTKRPATRRPAESLKGGTEPDDKPEETDPKKLAAAIRTRY